MKGIVIIRVFKSKLDYPEEVIVKAVIVLLSLLSSSLSFH